MPIASAAAQEMGNSTPGPDGFIASRQAETAQVGRLVYRVRFDDGTWTHQPVAVCPAFTHYAFARYTQKTPTGEGPSFLAIYALDTPPAHSPSRPWQGGILLLPGTGLRNRVKVPLVEQKETFAVFNRIWSDEMSRAGRPGVFPALTWPALADCYARFGSQQPLNADQDERSVPTVDVHYAAVDGALIILQDPGPLTLSLSLRFDRAAQITSATLTKSSPVN